MATGDRLQKVLARAGIASRRRAEELITAGRVRVNGKIVIELGTRVDPRADRIEVDGRRIIAEPVVYYMFHKPRGTVTTLDDPEGRATIVDYLKEIPARVFPVGRLDFHTSGALLLTNDGDLAQALLHPRRSVAKTYVAKVRGVPTDIQIQPWREGMDLPAVEDGAPAMKTRPADVDVLRHAPSGLDAMSDSGTTWIKITLREGRNRQIHRMAEAVGLFVMRLARLAFAGLTTEGLRPGELRQLTEKEVTMLRATYLRPVEEAKGKPGSTKRAAVSGAGHRAQADDETEEGGEDSPFAPEPRGRPAAHAKRGNAVRARAPQAKSADPWAGAARDKPARGATAGTGHRGASPAAPAARPGARAKVDPTTVNRGSPRAEPAGPGARRGAGRTTRDGSRGAPVSAEPARRDTRGPRGPRR